MPKIELEVYSDASNSAVIQTPGRRFPGSVIQGDSLAILCEDLRKVALWVEANSDPADEVRWVVQSIHERLLDRLLHYQTVLQQNGIKLPYVAAATHTDLVALIPRGAPDADC